MSRIFRLTPLMLVPLLAVACADSNPTPTGDDMCPAPVGTATSAEPIQIDYAGLPTSDPDDPRTAVGVTATVDTTIEFADVDAAALSNVALLAGHGELRASGTGFTWTAVVQADNAAALRLHLTDLFLSRNASLTVTNDRGEVAGPYTRRDNGELWTSVLMGDRVTLQLDYTGSDTARVLHATHFTLSGAGVLDDRFLVARYQQEQPLTRSLCSYNAGCVENADCGSLPGPVATARNAIALIVFVSGAYQYICSGGLIADTDPGSTIPYFLTAHHCISKSREASSVETYFQYEAGSCSSPTCSLGNTPANTVGASIVKSNRDGDYTLLRLSGNPPAGSTYLTVNHDPVAYSSGKPLFRISHPAGAPQAYSTHSVDTSTGTCSSWPRGGWIYSHDTYGATEGGSSGSPVLDAEGHVVGQLSGGCGYNLDDVCDADSNATVDGAIAYYWDDVAPFLAPSGSCTDADDDGFCAEDDCDDNNAAINPDATEVCDDLVDNDCDGDVDGADAQCATGTCDLGAVGDLCASDDECCSAKCKGKPGAKTCR